MNTTKLKIQLYGSYFLRRKALPVERVNEEIRDILCQMLQLMYTHKGIGLAANQVGILKRLIVIDIGRGPLKMINPCILKKKGEVCIEEGCLSLPQTNVKVKRARNIEVEYLNEKGKVSYLKAVDLLSICIQHEICLLYTSPSPRD